MCAGMTRSISQPGIALVGTRHPTPYGSGMSERLACDLAARGLVIFSGMARGVDTAGHRGAIAAKGQNGGRVGHGRRCRLSQGEHAASGTDSRSRRCDHLGIPHGTFPAPQNFPIRNRIISGISIGRAGGGSCGIQRYPHHRALRLGAEPRGFRRTGKRHQQRIRGGRTR